MVEENNEEEKVEVAEEVVKKKRGRPKKVAEEKKEEVKEEVINVVEEVGDKIPTPQEPIEPIIEEEKVEVAPLNDNLPFPEQKELTPDDIEHLTRMNKIAPQPKEIKWWEKFFNSKKIEKPNTVAILLLYPRRAVPLYKEYDEDGMFTVEDIKRNPLAKKYHVREDCIYTMDFGKHKIPLCILPVWSMIPLGNQTWFELSQERRGLELQEEIRKAIIREETVKEDEKLKKKGGLSGKAIWIFIAIVVIGYLIWKGTGH